MLLKNIAVKIYWNIIILLQYFYYNITFLKVKYYNTILQSFEILQYFFSQLTFTLNL